MSSQDCSTFVVVTGVGVELDQHCWEDDSIRTRYVERRILTSRNNMRGKLLKSVVYMNGVIT
jgi:hypothetical protein